MRILLLILAFIALAFFASQRMLNPQLNHNSIADRLQHPLDPRLRYRIGNIDPRFNIDHEQLKTIAEQAADIWLKGTAESLFVYDPNARLSINLIYDHRQEDSNARKLQINQLEQTRRINQDEYQSIQQSENELKVQQQRIEQHQTRYKQQLDHYNREVQRFNQSSSQSQAMLNYLNQRKAQLNQEAQQLQQLVDDFNHQIIQANQMVNQYNQQNQHFNASVEQFNQRFQAKQFDKGQFNGQAINIYEFQGMEDLRLTIAHELGHALGLAHTDNPASLMYPILEQQNFNAFELTPADLILFHKRQDE